MTLAEIISDDEIIRVHGHANFGPTMTPRGAVNDGVRKYAVGYSSGHTQLCILLEHGLITKPRPGRYDANLTKKGKRYARALGVYQDAITAASAQARIAELEADIRFRNERWNAAEVRADRLAKALEPFVVPHECDGHATVEDFNMEVQVFVRWAVIKVARAALSNEPSADARRPVPDGLTFDGNDMTAVADALRPWMKNYPPSTRTERCVEAANAILTTFCLRKNVSALAAAPASPLPGGGDILWMMHVRGPDDIYPAPDYETAVAWCDYVNDVLAKAVPEVMTKAVPAIWTGTPESHADGLPDAIKGWTLPAAPTGDAK